MLTESQQSIDMIPVGALVILTCLAGFAGTRSILVAVIYTTEQSHKD